MTRQECEEFLSGKPEGAFVVRRSSRDNCLALSHIVADGSIGHAIIFCDEARGFRVENDDAWHSQLEHLLDVFELVFDSDGLGRAKHKKPLPNIAVSASDSPRPLPAAPAARGRPPLAAPPPVPRPGVAVDDTSAAVRSRSPPPPSSVTHQNDRIRSKSPQPVGSALRRQAPQQQLQQLLNLPPVGAVPGVAPAKNQVAQLVADLNDPTAAKRALFTLKDLLLGADFARSFIEAGGYAALCGACMRADGNTLAYGLSALHVCVQHYRESDADAAHPAALEQLLMATICTHFESLNTGVSKGALEVFIQLNRRRKVDVYAILRQQHTDELACASLVRLLGHSDVDCHQRALTLINAVVTGFQSQPLAAKLELYAELARAGIYERFLALRSSQDVMVRTQLCAFQITRLALTRERMSTPYDKTNAEHEAALLRLWALTFPDVPLENRISSQWSKVGFQGTDPATDFRGFGVLGLDAMLHFAAAHTDEWRSVIVRNNERGAREYPVATAVINACKLVNDLFHLADGTSAQSDLLSPLTLCDLPFESLVHVAMLIVDRQWDDMNASYMQFPAVIAAVKAELEAGAQRYASIADWHAALRRGEKVPVKVVAEKAKGGGLFKRLGNTTTATAAAVTAKPAPAPMPRPMPSMRQQPAVRKDSLLGDTNAQQEIERLKAQLKQAQDEIASLRKPSAAPLSPGTAPRNMRGIEEVPMGEVFLDDECVHSGRAGGVYFATWYADRVAIRIFGANHEELANRWRQGEALPSINADARLVARRELQRLTAAAHPNVCLAIGSVKGAPALLYEALSCDLRSYLHQFNFSTQQRVFLALDAARGVSFLHRRSPPIVAGNLATSHFLVDSAGTVRVASLYNDPQQLTSKGAPAFGDVAAPAAIASWCRDAVWNIDPAFAAPEVFARGTVSTASDVFSVGVLLCEIVSGQVPWADASVPSIIEHVLHNDRLPFVASAAVGDTVLQQLMINCTNRQPATRPSMVDVALALLEHASLLDEAD